MVKATAKLTPRGNSRAVPISKEMLEAAGLSRGDDLSPLARDDGVIEIGSPSTTTQKRIAMYKIRPMTADDYEAVINLMTQTPGVAIRDADSRELTLRYLERNPGLSFVALIDDRLGGCVMSGHDGRRGYLQHLAVLPQYRRKGIATALVERCLSELESLGILKCHIEVFGSNTLASAYWESQGWRLRTDINRYSFVRTGAENA